MTKKNEMYLEGWNAGWEACRKTYAKFLKKSVMKKFEAWEHAD